MEISLAPELLFSIFGFPITNSFFTTLVVSVCIISASLFLRHKISQKPKGFQNVVEFILESILDLADNVTGDRKKSKAFFPFVATIFILVIISNWIGLIPALIPGGTLGLNEIHHGENVLVPFIRSGSADLNMTLSIALISVITAQIMGVAMIGGRRYAGKFFVSPFKKPYFIGTFVGILEVISEFAKVISFSFRLFGNVFAGEVLLTVMLMLVPYFAPLPFLFLEIFVGFVQALVFAMLTLVFFKMATEAH
jgi:F-type H+-transporting ATPase subunit a